MLAIRRFSIGLCTFHQFLFIDETVYVGDFFRGGELLFNNKTYRCFFMVFIFLIHKIMFFY